MKWILIPVLFLFSCSLMESTDDHTDEILLLAILSIKNNSFTSVRPTYNHPAALLGHWSGLPSDTSFYCFSYVNLNFYDDNYGWLQKVGYYDPAPTIQPCQYFTDISYGSYGYYYMDWKVDGNLLCEKLSDNQYSQWSCKSYTVTSTTLVWNGVTYKR